MAKVNRLSGIVSGKIGDDILYRCNGRQMIRKGAGEYDARNTKRWQEIKYYVAVFSSLWVALPAEIKALWGVFASSQGSASEVEANDNVAYLHNPITNYPSRPKLLNGEQAFVGLNCKAALCKMDVPRYYPPIGVEIPPNPTLEFRGFDRATREIVISVRTPELGERAEQMSDRKICIWISALKRKYIVYKYCIDIIDIPAKPTTLELRYKQVDATKNEYGNKPLIFGEIGWVNINMAAQAVTAIGPKWAPQVSSSSNVLVFTLLNDPRLAAIHDLIAGGQLIMLSRIKFNDRFYENIDRMRRQGLIHINPAKKRNVVIGG